MYYIMAEALLEEDAEQALAYYNEVREHRGLKPLETETVDESTGEIVTRPLTLEHINEERYKEFFGEGQLFFNMKRLNQSIVSFDGATTYQASKKIYVVPTPDIEIENRY